MSRELRAWQRRALAHFAATRSAFLVDGCVGSGKSYFAAHAAAHELASGAASFVLVVVPYVSIKSDVTADFSDLGLQLADHITPETTAPPRNFVGAVVTYQALPYLLARIQLWVSGGTRLFVVFDEIHHCADGRDEQGNDWGGSAETYAALAERVLSMTGTPFRSDRRRITFVQYDAAGQTLADARYRYEEAVAERVCRPVLFLHDDSIARYLYADDEQTVRVSESPSTERGRVAATIFARGSDFLQRLIAKADERLNELRLVDPDAACLIVCRPGYTPKAEERHLRMVARLVEQITHERPDVVSYDNADGEGILARFRSGSAKYLVAVRKVSEGVNIKRLRLLVLAAAPETELLFRQLVGRIVRQEQNDTPEEAIAFIPKFPWLVDFAARFRKEAECGLEQWRAATAAASDGGAADSSAAFQPLDATHEDGGGIAADERFADAILLEAAALARGDPVLAAIPLQTVAHILAKRTRAATTPPPPLQTTIAEKRDALAARLRKLGAILQRNGSTADPFATAATRVWRRLGVKDMDDLCDNHPVERLETAIEIVDDWIATEIANDPA